VSIGCLGRRCRARCGGAWLARGFAIEHGSEAIAAPRDRGDRLRPEGFAQAADLHLQIVLRDHQAGPDGVEQFVLGNDPVAAFHQRQQQVESARPQTDRPAVNHQLAF
jgi:hypothetical protein